MKPIQTTVSAHPWRCIEEDGTRCPHVLVSNFGRVWWCGLFRDEEGQSRKLFERADCLEKCPECLAVSNPVCTEKATDKINTVLASLSTQTDRASAGPWLVATSCSWRRIVKEHTASPVVTPMIAHDGHPDLGARAEDLDFIVMARRALPFLVRAVQRVHDWTNETDQGTAAAEVKALLHDALAFLLEGVEQ